MSYLRPRGLNGDLGAKGFQQQMIPILSSFVPRVVLQWIGFVNLLMIDWKFSYVRNKKCMKGENIKKSTEDISQAIWR